MGIKIIAKNKRAFYDYFIQEVYEAGLCLLGTEIKGLRTGGAQITESFITIDHKGEAWVYNMRIAHYQFGNQHNHQETRKRKLLLHKKEIEKIKARVQRENLSIIPLKIYLKNSHAKMEVGLAKGKKKFDKRETIKARDAKQQMHRSTGQ